MELEKAIRGRRSIRAFLPDAVPLEVVRELLEVASCSPSGTNVQPWKVHVVAGAVRAQLEQDILAHRETRPSDDRPEISASGTRKEPYLSRMRALGKDMYSRIGIVKGDETATWRQWGRNYAFFDAPVGLIFTLDRDLESLPLLDVGMFMQTFMLAARDRGLDTCAQGAWNLFWTVTKRVLSIPEHEHVVAGMALGYADRADPVNGVIAAREPLSTFATFHWT